MNNTENQTISEEQDVSSNANDTINVDNSNAITISNIGIAKLSIDYDPSVLLTNSPELEWVNSYFDSVSCR